MGILDKVFGNKKDYPALNQTDPAARRLDAMRQPLEEFVNDTTDNLEVVPGEDTAYIFIGKPPKKFGVAWIEGDGEIVNFRTLVEKKGLSEMKLQSLSNNLREVYIQHKNDQRFTTKIQNKDVVVTPSNSLVEDVKKVVKDTVG